MGDLIIRNLDDDLKRQLRDQARQNGRSLSQEASVRLQQSLSANGDTRKKSAGEVLRVILTETDAYWTDGELEALDAARHAPDREPPRFDE